MWLVSGASGTLSRSPIARARRSGAVDRPRGLERDAAKLGRQRGRAVDEAMVGVEETAEVRGRVAVAAVLEHPREQLVGRLLGAELDLLVVLLCRQQQARLELQQRSDQDQELGRRLELELARSPRGARCRRRRSRRARPRPGSLLRAGRRPSAGRRARRRRRVRGRARLRPSREQLTRRGVGGVRPKPIASRTSRQGGGGDRARLLRARLEQAVELGLVGPQLRVALAHRRQVSRPRPRRRRP